MILSRLTVLVLALYVGWGCRPGGDDSTSRAADEARDRAPNGVLDSLARARPGSPSASPTARPTPGSPPIDATPQDTDFPFVGTAGIVDKKRPYAGVAILRDVRSAPQPGFDRVVFEFSGDSLPGYHLEYIDRPVRQCASGDVVPLKGDAWLQVSIQPAQAHDDMGRATVTERAQALAYPNLKVLKLTCDFEAEVAWVLGVATPAPYRVLELREPLRLVVDVRHR